MTGMGWLIALAQWVSLRFLPWSVLLAAPVLYWRCLTQGDWWGLVVLAVAVPIAGDMVLFGKRP